MTITVKLLVVDDEPRTVKIRLRDALLVLANTPNSPGPRNLSFSCPWTIPVPGGEQLTVECDFCSEEEDAQRILFDQERLKSYDLILLDNSWKGNREFGL